MASRGYGSGAGKASDIGVGEPTTDAGAPPTVSHATRSATDPPLRDPGRYALTDHFLERVKQPGRYVTIEAASEAIATGQLRWNTTDGWRFAHVEDGIRYLVVVGDTETSSPVVVTGWTEIADLSAAHTAERWDETDVETIQLREALSRNSRRQIPDHIRPREVPRPFTIGKHHVQTTAGDGYVVCQDCDGRFRSKSDLTTRHCRKRVTDGR